MRSGEREPEVGEPPVFPTDRDIDSWFQRITETESFRSAPVLSNLLVYLWQQRSHSDAVSEFAIATEALGRKPDFDPKVDASVRVQIARLRTRLKEFYSEEGETFPLRLSIPRGGHNLEWKFNPPTTEAAPPAPPLRQLDRRILIGLLCACFGLATLSGFLLLRERRLTVAEPEALLPLPRFWQSFLDGGKPTSVVLNTPLVFAWPDQRVHVRDLTVTDFASWRNSPVIQKLAAEWGPPSRGSAYLFGGDMSVAVKMLEYLKERGRSLELLMEPQLPIGYSSSRNTIFVGGPRSTSVYLGEFRDRTNFYFAEIDPDMVRNRNPKPGETAEVREIIESGQRRTHPGIIALLPKTSEGTQSLLLIGRFTPALAWMLVSEDGLELLDQQWSSNGRPAAWEMVVQAEVHLQTILNARVVGFRAIEE